MRLIDADKYINHLRANINSTSDIIAKQIKKDKPIGTVADGGQIGYLNALQWARASLECDCYTVKAIPIPDNATNGDMIKAMFPNANLGTLAQDDIIVNRNYSNNDDIQVSIPIKWWNALYKRGNEDDSN